MSDRELQRVKCHYFRVWREQSSAGAHFQSTIRHQQLERRGEMRTFCGILCLLSALALTTANTIASTELYCVNYKKDTNTWSPAEVKCKTEDNNDNKCTTAVLHYNGGKVACKSDSKDIAVYNMVAGTGCNGANPRETLQTSVASLQDTTDAGSCIDIETCKKKISEMYGSSHNCAQSCHFEEGTAYDDADAITKSSPHFACEGCVISGEITITKKISDCGPINVIFKRATQCSEDIVAEALDCESCTIENDQTATCFGCPSDKCTSGPDPLKDEVFKAICPLISHTCKAVEKSINNEDCKAELLGRVKQDTKTVKCTEINLTYDQESKELTAELTGCGGTCDSLDAAEQNSKCDDWINTKLGRQTPNCTEEEEEEEEDEKEEEEVTTEAAAAADDITTTAATVSATSTTTPKSSVDVFTCDECKEEEHKKCNDKKDECECVDKYEDKDGTCKKKDTGGNNNGAGQQPENTTAGAALAHVTPLLLLPAAALLALVA